MKHIKTLVLCSSISQAINLIDELSEEFRKAHKRNEKVELTVAISSHLNKDSVEIRCHYQTKDESDYNWFVTKIKERN